MNSSDPLKTQRSNSSLAHGVVDAQSSCSVTHTSSNALSWPIQDERGNPAHTELSVQAIQESRTTQSESPPSHALGQRPQDTFPAMDSVVLSARERVSKGAPIVAELRTNVMVSI